jgi:RNA polymerase sigma factor (TIGR02999 family)
MVARVEVACVAGHHALCMIEVMAASVTVLLRNWRSGDPVAFDELMPIVYDELHRLATNYLRGERAGHTFRPTDLVSEAYMRLAGANPPDLNDRVHFFAVAARNMRQILVDHARKRCAGKRGGGERAISLDDNLAAAGRPDELVALDDALEALAKFDERKARAVELHYFGGLSQDEIAKVLDVHVNTIARDLRVAEAWIHRHVRDAT